MYRVGRVHTAVNVVLAAMLVVSLLPIFTQPVAARELSDDSQPQFEPVTDVTISGALVDKGNLSSEIKAAAANAGADNQSVSTYIVQLMDQPVALYQGGTNDLRATSPRMTGATKLDMNSSDVRAYASHLAEGRANFLGKVEETLGRDINVLYEYYAALNGVAIDLTLAEVAKVAALPNVRFIEPDREHELHTFAGPEWMGAGAIWDGLAGIPGTRGEGIVVGIIDTGINPTNPSFADIGGDGYDHTNPNGAGNYAGVCNPADPSFDPTIPCNDKLIGIWGFPTVNGGNPVDFDGHGSHTGSTAAGNVVNEGVAVVTTDSGYSVSRTISGVAPHANVIAYAACCTGAALSAARDQALIDGVDVINYSIGSTAETGDIWNDAESIQWLSLRSAGVFVATSAGNSGNGSETIGSPGDAPWLTTVGASTHDVAYLTSVVEMTGGDTTPPADILGRGTSTGYGPAPIVYAGDFGDAVCLNPFAEGTFDGEIVVCDRGENARKAKGTNALAGGAGGMILAEVDTPGIGAVLVDTHVLPAAHITTEDGEILKAWIASGSGHMGRITATELNQADGNGDIMAKFSSRGTNRSDSDLIVPSVTAPGVGIFAAYAVGVEFDVIQGTSMSSPHVAGAGALMKAVHPDWSASEIESALMTTANTNVLDDDGVSQAPVWAMGSGRVDLAAAARAGLTLHETQAGYLAANPADGGDASQINRASVGEGKCVGSCSWTRTVTNKLDVATTWTVATSGETGMTITVEPSSFTVAPGASQGLAISVALSGIEDGTWVTGAIVLTEQDDLAPAARMPVATKMSFGSLPDAVTFVTRRSAGSYPLPDVEAIAITDLTIDAHGLVKGDLLTTQMISDPDNSTPYDAFGDPLVDGAFFITIDVPAGTERLVAELPPGGSESSDLDLFVGTGSTPAEADELCSSTSGTAIESCILTDPAAGTYWVLVQNWSQTNGGALPGELATLVTAVVPMASAGNMHVEGPSAVPAGELFDLRLFYDESSMTAGDRWYGSFSVGTDPANAGNMGTIPVTILRIDDDVTKSVDDAEPAPGDTVTYSIMVQPNVMPEDLNYTMMDTIPAGMTYVEGSVTGGATVEGNKVMWSGTMAVPELVYNISTSLDDALCDTGFGGYVDLEAFGILAQADITGDTTPFTAFSSGNPFNFYGDEYTGVGFTDDGFIVFDPATNYAGSPWIPQSLPNADAPNNVAALLWQDYEIFYDAALNHGVSLATAGANVAIIEYDDLQPFGGGDSIGDMEIVLSRAVDDTPGFYEIVMAYDNLNALPPIATIGLEDASGTRAAPFLNLGDPSAVLSDGLMICYDLQGAANPVEITYQVTIDENEELCDSTLTNSVAHNTDNPGGMEAIASADVTVDCTPPNSVLYMSPKASGPIGGLNVSDEDIVAYDTLTGNWSMVFDGSDMGLSANDVDGVAMMDDGSMLISLIATQMIDGLGNVKDSDILHFAPTSLGSNTAGSFALYFDGSDVNLGRGSEDIDAIALLGNGDVLLSTSGSFNVPGVGGRDEDMFHFVPTSLGGDTNGGWIHAFDGSDVDLRSTSEDVDGGWINPETGDIYLTTEGFYSVRNAGGSSLSGGSDDILSCTPTSLGTDTGCVWSLVWDGEAAGLKSWMGIDGFAFGDAIEMAASAATTSPDDVDEIDTVDNVDDSVEANDENDSDAAHNADDLSIGEEFLFLPVIE